MSSKQSKLALGPAQSSKKVRPLVSALRPPIFKLKGNIPVPSGETDVNDDDRLWIDRYEPTTEADLAVHKRKVEDVRRWLIEAFDGGAAGKLKKYRRILVLTGPAGTAKTTTVRVLGREIGFDVVEWRNATDDNFAGDDYNRESLNHKFETFLMRASACRPLSSGVVRSSSSSSHRPPSESARRKQAVILLEDLPNILHGQTQASFHDALNAFVESPPGAPLVIIISDSGARGEAQDERNAQNGFGLNRDVINVRGALPPHLLGSPYVTQISFNPIAPTLMRRSLQTLLSKHFAKSSSSQPPKESLDIITESSNGDIRSAVMALQFACVMDLSGHLKVSKGKKKPVQGGTRAILEAITRREQSLALFHLMGKVLYNKRKGDPQNSSAAARDIIRDKELDAKVRDPPPLPPWLSVHERRGSRVDVDTLYADSPVETSLLGLYIHQNYTQYCDDLDECGGVSDWLSWVDSSGGEQWHQANPHQFHLLTLGTLHSLPSPVPRRSQKLYKPEFFDVLKKMRAGEDGILDVRLWLQGLSAAMQGAYWEGMRAGGWSRDEIVQELGAVLKARDTHGYCAPPPSHRSFSCLYFTSTGEGMQTLTDGDEYDGLPPPTPEDGFPKAFVVQDKGSDGGGWLESDDIEDS